MIKCKTCDGKGTLPDKYVPGDLSNKAFIWDRAYEGYTIPGKMCLDCNGTGKTSDILRFVNHMRNDIIDDVIAHVLSEKSILSNKTFKRGDNSAKRNTFR